MLLLFIAMQAVQPMPFLRPAPNAAIVVPALRKQQLIDDAHALLDRAARTRAELDATIAETKDSLADMDQTDQLRLQMAMDRLSKLMSTLSNMLKKMSDTDADITNNIK